MNSELPNAGVCLIRAEAQGERTLISVTIDDLAETGARSVLHFVDAEQALDAVRAFLTGISPHAD